MNGYVDVITPGYDMVELINYFEHVGPVGNKARSKKIRQLQNVMLNHIETQASKQVTIWRNTMINKHMYVKHKYSRATEDSKQQLY